MKILRVFLLIATVISLSLMSCSEKKTDTTKDEAQKDSTVKQVVPVEPEVVIDPEYKTTASDTIVPGKEHPQYIVSAKQGDYEFGEFVIELYPEVCPEHYRNFDSLVAIKFFDGTAIHRVVPNVLIQGGDPNSRKGKEALWGTSDPSQRRVPAEFNRIRHKVGVVSAARTEDPDGATSQFFISLCDNPKWDGQFTAFGRVVEGLDVVTAISVVQAKPHPNGGEPSLPDKKITIKVMKKK